MDKKEELWKCTICGSIGTVGRCCGLETRVRYIPPKDRVIRCKFCGRVRNGISERIGCLALSLLLVLIMIANYKLITIVW